MSHFRQKSVVTQFVLTGAAKTQRDSSTTRPDVPQNGTKRKRPAAPLGMTDWGRCATKSPRRRARLFDSGAGFAGLNLQPAAPRSVQQHEMTHPPQHAIEGMRTRKSFHDRSAAHNQLVEFLEQARVMRHVPQSYRQCVRSGLAAAGSDIDLGQIQVELRLAATAAQGAMA